LEAATRTLNGVAGLDAFVAGPVARPVLIGLSGAMAKLAIVEAVCGPSGLGPPVALSADVLKGGVPSPGLQDIQPGMVQFMTIGFPGFATWRPAFACGNGPAA